LSLFNKNLICFIIGCRCGTINKLSRSMTCLNFVARRTDLFFSATSAVVTVLPLSSLIFIVFSSYCLVLCLIDALVPSIHILPASLFCPAPFCRRCGAGLQWSLRAALSAFVLLELLLRSGSNPCGCPSSKSSVHLRVFPLSRIASCDHVLLL